MTPASRLGRPPNPYRALPAHWLGLLMPSSPPGAPPDPPGPPEWPNNHSRPFERASQPLPALQGASRPLLVLQEGLAITPSPPRWLPDHSWPFRVPPDPCRTSGKPPDPSRPLLALREAS